MSKSVDIVGVRVWERRMGQPSNRYAVYYKRDGAMYRGLVDAKDELDAWSAFAKLMAGGDHPPFQTKVYYDPMREQY